MSVGTSAEIDAMLRDAGVAVVFGGQSTYGVLDAPEKLGLDEAGTDFVSRDSKLIIRAGSLTSLVQGSAITIASVNYQVRRIRAIDDGALAEVAVAKV